MILYRNHVYAARKPKYPRAPYDFINYLALVRAAVEGIDPGTYFHSTVSLRHIAHDADQTYGLVTCHDPNEYQFEVEPTELGRWLYDAADLGSYPPRSAIHSWGSTISDKAWRLLQDRLRNV